VGAAFAAGPNGAPANALHGESSAWTRDLSLGSAKLVRAAVGAVAVAQILSKWSAIRYRSPAA
jgi:hypothetical protein